MNRSLLNIQHWQSKNGTRVFFVERHELPILDVEVIFAAGSAYDGDKYGISQLTNCMLDQGTKNFNAHKLAVSFDSLGAEFGVTSDRDVAKLGLRCLTNPKYLEPALRIMNEVIAFPRFAAQDFLRMQSLVVSAIEKQKQMPEAIARNVFYEAIYPRHPYGHSVLGTIPNVQSLNINALQQFYSAYYIPQNAIINIVGDIDQTQAASIAELLMKNLLSGTPANTIPPPISLTKKLEQCINIPSEQTHILIGQVGVRYDDDSYFPQLIGNDILGGSALTSRLFREIRVKRGLSYSVLSALSPLKAGGPFVTLLQTRKTEMKQALKITRTILDEFITNGPTQKELLSAKRKIINSFPLTLMQNYEILQVLQRISFYELPLSFLDNYCDRINSVTIAQVKHAFHRFPLNQMATIMVGSF